MVSAMLPGLSSSGYSRQVLTPPRGGAWCLLVLLVGMILLCIGPSEAHSELIHPDSSGHLSLSQGGLAPVFPTATGCEADVASLADPTSRGYIAHLASLLAGLSLWALCRSYRLWSKDFALRPLEPSAATRLLCPSPRTTASRLQVFLL